MLRNSDGPSSTLYESDLFADFGRVRHDLFLDKETVAEHLFAADCFDGSPQSPLNQTTWSLGHCDRNNRHASIRHRPLERRCLTLVRLLRLNQGGMIIDARTAQPGRETMQDL